MASFIYTGEGPRSYEARSLDVVPGDVVEWPDEAPDDRWAPATAEQIAALAAEQAAQMAADAQAAIDAQAAADAAAAQAAADALVAQQSADAAAAENAAADAEIEQSAEQADLQAVEQSNAEHAALAAEQAAANNPQGA